MSIGLNPDSSRVGFLFLKSGDLIRDDTWTISQHWMHVFMFGIVV